MSVFRQLLHTALPEPLVNVTFKKETEHQDTFTQYFVFDEDLVTSSIGVEFTEITPTTLSGYFTSPTFELGLGTPMFKGIETFNFTEIKFPFYFYTKALEDLDLCWQEPGGTFIPINTDGSVKVGLNVYNIPNTAEILIFTSTAATVGNYFTLTQFPFTGIDAFCVYNYKLSGIERLNYRSGYSVVCQSILPDDAKSSVILSSSRLFLDVHKNAMMGLNFKGGDPNVSSIPFGESMPTYIGNSKECANLSGETFPLPEKGTDSISSLYVGDISKFGLVSSISIWNRDYPLGDLKQWYEDNCIPLPAVYYDINKQLLTNRGNNGTDYFIDFSGNNLHATVQNLNPVNPDWVFNPWVAHSEAIEATSLYTGVFHATKLLTDQKRTTCFYVGLSNFVGFNSKISIFINKPAGKENASNASFSMGDSSWAETPFTQGLTEGVNVIEVPESSIFDSQYTNIARIAIPEDWWDHDEAGNRIETNTDFYVVFFPVYDQSKTVGYPTYAVSDFTQNDWNERGTANKVSIISYYKVDTTECSYPYVFRNLTSKNLEYSTSNVFVVRPFKARFKRHDGENISVGIDLRGYKNGIDSIIKFMGTGSSTGEITVDFPGYVVFSETPYTNPYVIIYLSPVGVYEQLPLETYFQFSKSIMEYIEGHYCYAQIPESPNFGTVIMDMEVSSDIEPEVRTVTFYKEDEGASGGNNIIMTGPANSNVSFGTEVAFTYSSSSGVKSYINGVLNTTNPTSEYFGKHITVANVGTPTPGSNIHYIGGSSSGGQSPFRLHKFMAFKEQLTEKQLVKVLEKYNFYMGN